MSLIRTNFKNLFKKKVTAKETRVVKESTPTGRESEHSAPVFRQGERRKEGRKREERAGEGESKDKKTRAEQMLARMWGNGNLTLLTGV